jgi:hypothetical protein
MLTWTAIWRALTKEERVEAVAALWDPSHNPDGAEAARAELVFHIAQTRSFRPATVNRMDAGKVAAYAATGKDPSATVIRRLLIAWHLRHRGSLLSRFLGKLGIEHEGGNILGEPAPPTEEALRDALRDLASHAAPADVARYLDCLELLDGQGLWANLAAARTKIAEEAAPGPRPVPPAVVVEEIDAPEERSSGFTTLDRTLIDSAVGTAQEVDGALSRDGLHDLVDEVISLSSTRHRSYFHRGFFEALFSDEQPDVSVPEMNDERRAWQLCGYLVGCQRRQKSEAMTRVMQAHEATVKQLASGKHAASGTAAPLIFEHVLKDAGLPAAARLVQAPAVLQAGPAFARHVLDEGIRLLRGGRIEEAAPALELLDVAIKMDGQELIPEATKREHLRRMGQMQRRRGGFDRAAKIFEGMLASDLPEWMRRRTLADLGLCRARCRALGDLRVPTDAQARTQTAKALAAGEREFGAAAGADIRTGGHGEFCLGVLSLLRNRNEEARPYFQRAVAEMSADEAYYRLDDVLPRARLYLAVTTLASSAPGTGIEAVDAHLRAALAAIPKELESVLPNVLFGFTLADAERAASFAAEAFARLGDAVLDAAKQAEMLPRLPQLRSVLLERARTEGRPSGSRFEDARDVLMASKDANDVDLARESFDVLEDLAGRTAAERRQFIDLTADLEDWEAVWDPHEAQFARVPLLIEDGRRVDAGHLLHVAARSLVARRDDDGSLDLARDAIDWAAELGVEAPTDLLREVQTKTPRTKPGGKPTGRVLFIGGNETQQQYDEYLHEKVHSKWPAVRLETIYTGWSSNWGREIPKIEGRLALAGAVVLMRFIRTMAGRRLRELCSQHKKPWVACTGHGRESLLRSIERAVGLLPSKG